MTDGRYRVVVADETGAMMAILTVADSPGKYLKVGGSYLARNYEVVQGRKQAYMKMSNGNLSMTGRVVVPEEIMKQGYSIVRPPMKPVVSIEEAKEGGQEVCSIEGVITQV